MHYSQSQGYYTVAARNIRKNEAVYELPCQYIITTYDDFEDKRLWYQLILNALEISEPVN